MKFQILLLTSIVALTGCANYRAGDCVQDVDDGYIWRITDVGLREYSIQGWQDQDEAVRWGLEGVFERDLADILLFRINSVSDNYVQIPCPFSTEVIKDEDSISRIEQVRKLEYLDRLIEEKRLEEFRELIKDMTDEESDELFRKLRDRQLKAREGS